jgi:hypothetical protein
VKVEAGSGVGRSYFCGLLRMTQSSFFKFMMAFEIINLFATIIFSIIIISD